MSVEPMLPYLGDTIEINDNVMKDIDDNDVKTEPLRVKKKPLAKACVQQNSSSNNVITGVPLLLTAKAIQLQTNAKSHGVKRKHSITIATWSETLT